MSEQREHPGADVVVYDLDGVITRKDTFTALLSRRLRASPVRLLRALPAAASWVSSRDPGRRVGAAQRLATMAFAGLDEHGYGRLADEFGRSIAADPSWMRDEAVQRIREQCAEGARIVIATASEQRVAEALLRHARVPYHRLSASQLSVTRAGIRLIDHRIAERKAEALHELGVPVESAEFVTDSATDLPTARLAARVTLIGASRRTRARFAREGVTLTPTAADESSRSRLPARRARLRGRGATGG